MPKALLVISEGNEEIEAVTAADILVRGGVDVTIASLDGSGPVKMSRNVILMPHSSFEEALTKAPYDAIVLPGGLKGSEAFVKSTAIKELLDTQEKEGRLIAGICAAPTALVAHGLCKGKNMTSHPSVKDKMEGGCNYKEDRVVIDGNLITSRSPGTAMEWSVAILKALQGENILDTVLPPLLMK